MTKPLFPPVGFCIYCGRKAGIISKEHIVPKALGGRWVLPKASCTRCAAETGAFEGRVTGPMLKAMRARYRFPSRTGHPETMAVDFTKPDGVSGTEHVSVQDHPAPIFHVKMRRAGILLGIPPGIERSRLFRPEVWSYAPGIQEWTLGKSWRTINNAASYDGLSFSRMLAKIGHAWAVAHHGRAHFEPLTLDLIRGRSNEIEHIVGGAIEERPPEPRLHDIASGVVVNPHGRFLVVAIRFFAEISGPDYHVVVGRLTPEQEAKLKASSASDSHPIIAAFASDEP